MKRYQTALMFFLFLFFATPLLWVGAFPSTAHAGGTIKIDDTRYVSVGMGLRSSFNTVEDAAPNKSSRSKDFKLDNIRLYVSGQFHDLITFAFNTEREQTSATTENIRVLDGVVKFGFNDYVNIWVGRFLPPSDRSTLSGPYFLNSWNFPFVQKYPAIFAGRDDGAAVWGQVGGGKFKYQVGAFQGQGATAVAPALPPNQKDDLLYAGRLTLNLWDPEPGYFNSSAYYGAKNVLAIGLVGMTQSNAVGTSTKSGDFTGWNVDLLVERNLGQVGVATLEGAYYNYDRDGVDPAVITGDALEGKGYFVLASYLLAPKIGGARLQGQLQPLVRYQSFKNGGLSTGDHNRYDIGLSYIINGHNARITADYFMDYFKNAPAYAAGASQVDGFQIGLQFQI